MKTSRNTAGATLVLTVLVVMLLLAAVVVVTAQLAISARRSSADQDATIQAQYVAESGVARAQARLGQARTLFTQGTLDQATTNVTTLTSLFANFCGVSVANLTLTPGTIAVPSVLCTAANSATSGSAVATLIPNSAYGAGVPGWSASTWNNLFSATGSIISGTPGSTGTNALGITGKVALKALSVQKTGTDSYVLNIAVADITSAASNSFTKRALKTSSTGVFALKISRPPFSTFAQFRNKTNSTAGPNSFLTFSQNESFNGPVHTNATLRLNGPTGPTFRGDLSTSTETSPGSGVPDINFGSISPPCNALTSITAGLCPTMYPDGAASFPHYVPTIRLPTNNNDQVRASLGLPQTVDPITKLPTPLLPTEVPTALGFNPSAAIPGGVYYSKASSPTTLMGGMYVQGDADVKLSTTNTTPRLQMIDITQPPAPAVGGVVTHLNRRREVRGQLRRARLQRYWCLERSTEWCM